jgi:hypothetical protein
MFNNAISPIIKYTLYRIANCIMAKYITNENGTLLFLCKKCDEGKYNAYRNSYIVFHSPNYMNLMLSIHLIYIQLLSLDDIGLHIEEKHWGFCVGQIIKKNFYIVHY